MRSALFIPIAALALAAAACSETTTSPTSVGRPLFNLSGGQTFGTGGLTNTSTAALPSGGHLQSGSIFCVVNVDLSVTCSSTGTYQINGVGNTNANALLSANYSATVDCTNHGGNLVEVKTQVKTATSPSHTLAPKNGNLTVDPITSSTPTDAQFEAAATCPNGNWTKSVATGSPALVSFEYTLLFVGFSSPTVDIFGS